MPKGEAGERLNACLITGLELARTDFETGRTRENALEVAVKSGALHKGSIGSPEDDSFAACSERDGVVKRLRQGKP